MIATTHHTLDIAGPTIVFPCPHCQLQRAKGRTAETRGNLHFWDLIPTVTYHVTTIECSACGKTSYSTKPPMELARLNPEQIGALAWNPTKSSLGGDQVLCLVALPLAFVPVFGLAAAGYVLYRVRDQRGWRLIASSMACGIALIVTASRLIG